MRISLLVYLLVVLSQLSGQVNLALTNTPVSTDTTYGDLDADLVDEMIILYKFADPVVLEDDPEVLAQATVYRLEQGEWIRWTAAQGDILYAFDEIDFARMSISIERGVLVVNHFKTGHFSHVYTRRFRWQNERFELIGATVANFGRCEFSHTLDYNLSSGRFTYEEYELSCEDVKIDEDYFIIEGRAKRSQAILLSEFKNNTHSVGLDGGDQHYF